jgi:dephospho-CoA kinase
MLKIGLTGGIGSGKSTVAGIFSSLGIPVYDADKAAKKIMNTSQGIREKIIEKFGAEAYANGNLNRTFLSLKVFNNEESLKFLNTLVHPITIDDANNWFQKQKTKYAIKEAALIFESHSNQYLDYVVGVSSPTELRIKRTMDRDHINAEKVIERMKKQMDEPEKMERCDFIINNNGKESVISQVLDLHVKLFGLASTTAK